MTDQQLQVVWPVIDHALLATPDVLLAEAVADLPAVARRSHARIVGPVRVAVRAGRIVPGSGGAAWVVHAVADAVPVPARPYRKVAR